MTFRSITPTKFFVARMRRDILLHTPHEEKCRFGEDCHIWIRSNVVIFDAEEEVQSPFWSRTFKR